MTVTEAWIDPKQLGRLVGPLAGATTTEQPSYPPELVDAAVKEATWLMATLAGAGVHPEQCWVEDYRPMSCEVRLLRTPVEEVTSVQKVHYCGDDPVAADWCLVGADTVSLCCGSGYVFAAGRHFPCGCRDDAVRVEYRIGSTLPPGTEWRVAWLAGEYLKAVTGAAGCLLPDRITNISRQGVSWTLLDPMDFLDKGMSGSAKIDTWLSAVRQVHPRAVLVDPLKSCRIKAVQVPCEGDTLAMVTDPSSPLAGQETTVRITGMDPGVPVTVDFGDGSGGLVSSAAGETRHTWLEAGTYTLTAAQPAHTPAEQTVVVS